MNAQAENVLAAAGCVRMRSGYLHMLDLLSGLADRGAEVTLLCGSIAPELAGRHLPFQVFYWHDVVGHWPVANPHDLGNFCAAQKIRLIHIHGVGLGPTVRRAIHHAALPVAFTPHSESSDRRAVRTLAQLSQRAVALSEYRREMLVNYFRLPRESVRVIPPGVELAHYEERLPQTNGHAPVIGTVAPFESGRGQNHFIEAAAQVIKSGREAEFVVAGDGREESALRRLAAALGIAKRVTFVTGLTNYRSTIAVLDIFVRPAVRGGMGYTILEAMAMGKAVLATATDDVPEMIDEGRSGLMVSKGDSRALGEAMIRLLDRPELSRRLGAGARQSVAKEFSMDNLVQRTVEMYDEAKDAYSRKEEVPL